MITEERLNILLVVAIFSALGHWWGSVGVSLSASTSFGGGCAMGVLLLMLLSEWSKD